MAPRPSFLSPIGFKFLIKRLPHVEFSVQNVQAPGISMGEAIQTTPWLQATLPGGTLIYDSLSVTIAIDEDMNNYFEIYNWLQTLAGTEMGPQYRRFIESDDVTQDTPYSDIQLMVLTSHNNPNLLYTYVDAFPNSLETINFDLTSQDIDYVTMSIGFSYKYWTVERVNP